MAENFIDPNGPIAPVILKSADAEEYTRQALQKMFECKKQHGTATLRIGVTGEGKYPNYRVGFSDAITTTVEINGSDFVFDTTTFGAFNGRTHKLMDDDYQTFVEANWSKEYLDYGALEALLGDIRSLKTGSNAART